MKDIKEKIISAKAVSMSIPRFVFRNIISSKLQGPKFIIIGAQKCGTTSLFKYLRQHPCVLPPAKKEIHYFDINYQKGDNWYKAHFPSKIFIKRSKKCNNQKISGEATPYYIFHPHVPKRIKKFDSSIKLIALLRNPTYRAYSHYYHEVKRGYETLSFEEAIKVEKKRLQTEIEKMEADENYYSFAHQHYSYLSSGEYVLQLKRWFKFFAKNQILLIKSEDMFKEPKAVYQKVLKFLGLPNWFPNNFPVHLKNIYPKIPQHIKKRLDIYFKPFNEELEQLLSTEINWST